MKKMLKFAALGVGVLVLLIGIAMVVLFQNLDKIIKTGTEKSLSFALQVPVTVDGVTVEATKGIIELRGLNIPNPEGYKTDHAMYFGKVRVEADIQSFKTDEPVINLIQVSEADMTLEKTLKSSNLQDLIKNAERLSSGEAAAEEEAPAEASQKAMKIKKVLVDGTTVQVAIPLAGGETVKVEVPEIEMTDLGGKKEKVTPAEAIKEFIAAILAKITSVGGDFGGQLKGLTSGVSDQAGELTKGLESTASGAADSVGDAAKGLSDSVGGLFGKKKKDADAEDDSK